MNTLKKHLPEIVGFFFLVWMVMVSVAIWGLSKVDANQNRLNEAMIRTMEAQSKLNQKFFETLYGI